MLRRPKPRNILFMRKLYYIICVLAILFTSCKKSERGGPSVQSMLGDWYVVDDGVNANLETTLEDPFGIGHFEFVTFADSNSTNQMWISDLGNFWEFQIRVDINLDSMTFETKTPQTAGSCEVTVKGGRIMPNATITPDGMPADSIICYISFSDDTYPAQGYYAYHRLSGYRASESAKGK